jgi:hypothetical protein
MKFSVVEIDQNASQTSQISDSVDEMTKEELKAFKRKIQVKKDAVLRKSKNRQFFDRNRDLTFNQTSKTTKTMRSSFISPNGKMVRNPNFSSASKSQRDNLRISSKKKKHRKRESKSGSKFKNYCESIEKH